jgi:hypothetical protein
VLYFQAVQNLLLDSSDGLGGVESGLKEETVGLAQATYGLLRKVVSSETHGIQSVKLRTISGRLAKRYDILPDG